MKTHKVSSICLYKNTDYEKLQKLVQKSQFSTFIICLEDDIPFPTEQIKPVIDYLHQNGKTVMLDTRNAEMTDALNPDILYITENAENRESIIKKAEQDKLPVLFRFVIDSKQKLSDVISEFRHYLTIYQNMNLVLRPGDLEVGQFVSWVDELVDFTMQHKVCLTGVPLCLTDKFTLSSKDVLDIGEVITDSVIPVQGDVFTKQYYKRKVCLECEKRHQCFGILKPAKAEELKPNHGKEYCSLYDIAEQMDKSKDLSHGILEFDPRNWKDYEIGIKTLNAMQNCRLKHSFDGENFFYIWDFKQSCYFNRPFEEMNVFTPDPRGLMGMNWQFIGKGIPELEWKQKCDLLLPEHGFNTTVKVKFDSTWSDEKQKALDELTFSTIIRIVKEHGGNGHIQQIGNDLLYDGRKFAGKEWMFLQNIGYIENTVVTCEYKPEKQYFDRLFHHPKEKQITGITEELPSVTKQILMQAILQNITDLIKN